MIDRDFFASYISYARKHVKPKLSDTITMDLVQEYVRMRSLGNSKKTITATPRQLESMIRIAEALAKMRLSEFVEKRDVDEAVWLIKHALQQSATDPTTGEINMDIITTGQTKTSTERLSAITDFIKNIQKDYYDKVSLHGLKYGNLLDFINAKAKDGALKKDGTATDPKLKKEEEKKPENKDSNEEAKGEPEEPKKPRYFPPRRIPNPFESAA